MTKESGDNNADCAFFCSSLATRKLDISRTNDEADNVHHCWSSVSLWRSKGNTTTSHVRFAVFMS